MALAVAAMGAWPQALLRHMNQLPGGSQPVLALPSLPGTNQVAAKLPEFQPVFQGPSAVAQRSYAQGSGVVSVHVAYYRDQRYGQKLVTSENMLVKPGDHRWNLTTRGGTAVDVDGQRIPLRTAEVISAGALGHGGRERLDVRQVYWVDGHLTASEHWAVIHGVWSRLLGRGDDGALLTFFTAGGAEEGTGQLLDGFIRTNLGALQTQLAATRAAR
jgi:EpsI family protein